MKRMESLALRYDGEKLWILDQEKLPREETWLEIRTPDEMVEAIRRLKVRGAPLIGVAAALALGAHAEKGHDLREAAEKLRAARPTAVNLMHAVDRVLAGESPETLFDEDVALCHAIGEHGSHLVEDGDGIVSHCNAGGLATAGIGTAIGVLRRAWEKGKRFHVYVDETRPLMQGARLTTWELSKLGIPHTLIADNMAGVVLQSGRAKKCLVGADRIAANGDFANKIGTYSLAVLARHHGARFYVAAPSTTLDPRCATGADIPIEARRPDEIRGTWAPADVPVFNPAFDVTPASLVSGYILDRGVIAGF